MAFNALPFARKGRAEKAAAAVEARNEARQAWADRVARPSGGLREKLSAAKKLAPKLLGRGRVAYSTEASADDQGLTGARVQDDLAAFDRLLKDE